MAVFNEPSKWQTSLVNSGDANTIPQTTPAGSGEASFEEGFPQITQVPIGAGGQAPDRKDFNGLFKVLGDWIFFAQNGGLPTYSANFDYVVGRYVVYNNTLYKCIQANGASSTVVAPDSVSPLGSDYWKDIENQDSTSLIPNQLIVSPVPLTDANLHLLDGALLSGSGAYSAYVAMMGELYTADPTANIWTDENSWQTSVTNTGSCGKFVYDSVNNTLRLPKYDARYLKSTLSASDLGDLVEAKAPNITGEAFNGTNIGLIQSSGVSLTNGAFFDKTSTAQAPSGASHTGSASLGLDASRSSSVYSDSATTIDTDAVKVYYYIVLGTVSKTQIQIDIDNVMTDLALKADTDLSNLSAQGLNRFANLDFSNVSQTAKNTAIEWERPDYSSGISITVSSSNPYTAPSAGWIMGSFNISGTGSANMLINGAFIGEDNNSGQLISVPLSKNDVVTLSSSSQTSGLYFFPCKGAN